MTARDIPNIISVLRIFLVIPVILFILQGKFQYALGLFFVAGASDALDGYLAKRNNWTSRLGSILDPLADKILLVSCYLALSWVGVLPVWLTAAILLRDVIILVVGIMYHYFIGQYELVPSIISKINTFLQIILILVVMFSLGIYVLPNWMVDALVYSVLATTVVSGLNYAWVWGRKARQRT